MIVTCTKRDGVMPNWCVGEKKMGGSRCTVVDVSRGETNPQFLNSRDLLGFGVGPTLHWPLTRVRLRSRWRPSPRPARCAQRCRRRRSKGSKNGVQRCPICCCPFYSATRTPKTRHSLQQPHPAQTLRFNRCLLSLHTTLMLDIPSWAAYLTLPVVSLPSVLFCGCVRRPTVQGRV